MTHQANRIPVRIYLMVATFLVVSSAPADQPKKSETKNENAQEAGPDADEQYRLAAKELVRGIEVEVLVSDKWVKVERIEKPLLYYGDATRENDRGSVWGWGDKGRPLVLLELFQNANDREKWVYTICNTSGEKVRASRRGNVWWRTNESASQLKDVPDAPAPAADAALRQRQMKQLAQKFSGHEFWDPDNSRFELRRLERPLHTYRDEDGGVLEGALYTLANGTNPEIMLFVEARVDPKDKSRTAWKFTVGRLSHAELHLVYDGKEVFDAPRADRAQLSAPDKPYWLGLLESSSSAKPDK
jgi:hypothetical protein